MDKLTEAVDNFVQRLEKAIAPGLPFKQFVTVQQSIEESVILELGDSALDHFIYKKFREQLAGHRVRLQQDCEERYQSRCRDAHKLLFEGGSASDLRQELFLHFSEYAKDPSCVERDWDQWSSRFLGLCGHGHDLGDTSTPSTHTSSLSSGLDSSQEGLEQQETTVQETTVHVQVPGEECRLLLGVLKSAAVQLVGSVNSEAALQVAGHKQALLRVHEQLDQSSLHAIRLQGEKENSVAICRSLESRVLELQQQQHSHAEAVRALHAQLSLSQLEARSNRQECETADLKCGKLVARLVAKTKEATAALQDSELLRSENESLKRQLRQDSGAAGGAGGKGGSKKGKKSAGAGSSGSGEGGGDEVSLLQNLNVTYSKQVLELQSQLDAAAAQVVAAQEAEECAAKLMRGDQGKLQHLQHELDGTARQLRDSLSRSTKLEGKLSASEEECSARQQHLQAAQDTHLASLRRLHEQHASREQEQASRLSLLQTQSEAARGELEAMAERLNGAVALSAQRLAVVQELTAAQKQEKEAQAQAQAQAATGTQKQQGDSSSSSPSVPLTLNLNEGEELLAAQRELESARVALQSEQRAHQQQAQEARRRMQQRVHELDEAYFRVQAELGTKTAEAKKHFEAVKQLQEETSALDRLRRKAELQLDEEAQKRLVAESTAQALQREQDALREQLRQSREGHDALQREHAIMGVAQEAAVEDLAALLDRAEQSKEVIASLRLGVGEKNDLEFALSVASTQQEELRRRVGELEQEVITLSPLRGEVTRLESEVKQLQSRAEQVAAAAEAVSKQEVQCEGILTQFEEVSALNTLLVAESVELEEQLETLSLAFEQRGELLADLERRLDVSSSDAAYLRGDNGVAREQVRELGEKVQTLMSHYNEASEQNEEKGFALLQLNGQQHELQSNLSKLAGELSELRDLPAQLSALQAEHSRVSSQLTETLATLDELSLLSAGEMQQKDAALGQLQQRLDEVLVENKVQAEAHRDLLAAHAALGADREALFAAYSVLDDKLSHLEAEIME